MRVARHSPAGPATSFTLLLAFLLALLPAGCARPLLPVRPVAYDIDAALDPQSHSVNGRTVIQLAAIEGSKIPSGAALVEFRLHDNLEVDQIEVSGGELVSHTSVVEKPDNEVRNTPRTHRLLVKGFEQHLTVAVEYHGKLHQDITQGEDATEIHNFAMSAHVGTEGVYLASNGFWYPLTVVDEANRPELALADYRLRITPIEGFEFVPGLERGQPDETGKLTAESPFPMSRAILLGGPRQRWTRQHGPVTLHAVLDAAKPGAEQVAQDLLNYTAELLDRYQPLVGSYPYKEFTVLEAFFSSGFAFPACTQLSPVILSERQMYRRHGYLDHELLHAWWGNAIEIDPRDGNWCEALASFAGNYYGFVIDGDEEGARKARRNASNFLSDIKPEQDKPLGTYGLPEGAGRGIAYQKGAAVFTMLLDRIGADAFFAGLRRLTNERVGGFANWDDLRQAFEAESGQDLAGFFQQWVRRAGAPQLKIDGAEWAEGSHEVTLWLTQGKSDFDLEIPLRLYYGTETEDTIVRLTQSSERLTIPCRANGLTAIELDPDYRLFRRLAPSEIMPTCNTTKRGPKLVVVVPDGELWQPYQIVQEQFTKAVQGDEDHPKPDAEVTVVSARQVRAGQLDDANVLVLGEAVHADAVQELLNGTDCQVNFTEPGFTVAEQPYAGVGDAVFFTVRHPTLPGGGVTVYYGNSEAALGNAAILGFYPNSLLVFHAAEGAEQGRPDVVQRLDFERPERVEF